MEKILKPRKKRLYIISTIILVIAVAAYFLFLKPDPSGDIVIKPKRSMFTLSVTTSGELRAKKSIDIRGPSNVQSAEIFEMKISKLVPEGTVVDSGAFVAELDRTEILSKLKDIQLSIQKFDNQYQLSTLDSTQDLSNARDELENLKFSMEEKILQKQLSTYEAPSIIRQTEIDYERTERAYNQALKNYVTKVKKAVANLNVVRSDLTKEQQRMERMMQVMSEFTIMAPAPGMVIYAKDWDGRSKEVGSVIRYWDPVVATLPDLKSMESVTYVNEIDYQKVKPGQAVNISLDANPGKKLTGTVTKVANIGQTRKGSDSKVFEVVINVNESDTTLRPSMTTSNQVVITTVENSLFIPLECIHSETMKKNDQQGGEYSISYVFKKSKGSVVKQQVELGLINENEAIITKGLGDNDDLLMSIPKNAKDLKWVYLN
jgi:multidrug resistance efflux pump